MKVLVTGAKGQLGTDLVLLLESLGYKTFGLGKSELDITNELEVKRKITDINPDIVIHCAAYTNVDKAEADRDSAFLINGIGTRNVVLASESIHSKLIYISTDYVFDGSSSTPYHEFSPVSPLNVYGQSKLAGESYVRDFHSRFFIVRTSWVFGAEGDNFVKKMLKLYHTTEQLTVINDQVGCPTYTVDLAMSIVELMISDKYGIYHISNTGSCSWFEFAKEIFRQSNIQANLKPCTTEELSRPAKRPMYSVMDHVGLRINSFSILPHWQDALNRFLIQIGRKQSPDFSNNIDEG
ncbi:dTDP-4-dehydrorhamnose reductase [Schinkia azotoformans]|nr:dTDP-4-dehydrorhamnose reductase [Schinkia azotoformans]MED4367185.1 dTDP-4-dehydrorhamnose reductase [Schinkia azotoformans]